MACLHCERKALDHGVEEQEREVRGDVNVDAGHYRDWYINDFLSEDKEKMWRVAGEDAIGQHNGETPHTEGTLKILNEGGRDGGGGGS